MKMFHAFSLSLATILAISASPSLHAQVAPPSSQPDSIAVSISLDKDHVPVGQSPWAIIAVQNLTDHEIEIHDRMVRIRVEGEKGEPPTTLVHRAITGKLLPGDRPMRIDEMAYWTISPGEKSSHKYDVSGFYDIKSPGSYTVYMEVLDPVTHKWLRTKTVKFDIQVPAQ